MLRPILEGLDMNDFMDDVDAIITGYLPTEELVHFAIEAVTLVKAVNPNALYLCDPVLGDDPVGKVEEGALYIDLLSARTLQYELLPLANISTPNRFELSWLTDMPVHTRQQAQEAMDKMVTDQVLASSISDGTDKIYNLLKTTTDLLMIEHPRKLSVPHGTGDLLAAFYLATLCDSKDVSHAFAQSTAYVHAIIEQSTNRQELNLIGAQDIWVQAKPSVLSPQKQKTKS
jgi:pyridoxine kinase